MEKFGQLVLLSVNFVDVKISESESRKKMGRTVKTGNIFSSDVNAFDVLECFHFARESLLTDTTVRFFGFGIRFYQLTDLVVVQVLKADWT